MNCLRSLEFIKKIDKKYGNFGLETILIHPPEWSFEKNSNNIINAMKKYRISLPMVIDKNKKILKKLKINFWPTQILINNGKTLYKHIGEGNYKELEYAIMKNLNIRSKNIFYEEPKYSKFPTVYCGKSKKGVIKKTNEDKKLRFGINYIDDSWIQKQEYIKSLKNKSSLTISTKGKMINFVAESLNKNPVKITVKLNDKSIKKLVVNNPKLYYIAKLKGRAEKMTIIAPKNVAIYSFSFQ